MRTYKRGAKYRGLEWTLAEDEFRRLTSGICHYCLLPPQATRVGHDKMSKKAKEHGRYKYNGIDHVDSKLGYTTANVVTCCTPCNRIKMNYSLDWLMPHLERMVSVYKKRG